DRLHHANPQPHEVVDFAIQSFSKKEPSQAFAYGKARLFVLFTPHAGRPTCGRPSPWKVFSIKRKGHTARSLGRGTAGRRLLSCRVLAAQSHLSFVTASDWRESGKPDFFGFHHVSKL